MALIVGGPPHQFPTAAFRLVASSYFERMQVIHRALHINREIGCYRIILKSTPLLCDDLATGIHLTARASRMTPRPALSSIPTEHTPHSKARWTALVKHAPDIEQVT